MVDRMDSEVTLTTSDDPPVSLSISRYALMAHSKVFADMLSLNLQPEDGDTSIPLSDTQDQVRLLLVIIQGDQEDREQQLSKMNEDGWEELAKLADKYDCQFIRKEVEAKIWKIEAKNESAALAFTLATLINHKELICYTTKRAVMIPNLRVASFHATQEWKERLALWRTLRMARVLATVGRPSILPRPNCCSKTKKICWGRMCGFALASYDLFRSPPLKFALEMDETNINLARWAEEETSRWDPFPLTHDTGAICDGLLWEY